MDSAESGVVAVLREVIERRKVKLTSLAEQTGLPYRSLQNYMRQTSRMPLAAYLDICKALGVPAEYPVERRFKLDHHALQQAIIDSAGPLLNAIELDQDSKLSVRTPRAHDDAHVRRVAGFLAAIIAGRYDLVREGELFQSLGDVETE